MSRIKITELPTPKISSIKEGDRYDIVGGHFGAKLVLIRPEQLPSFEDVKGLIELPGIDEEILKRMLKTERYLAEQGKLYVSTASFTL